jgi:cytochrome c oxidase cbb3-type subunit 3
MRHYAAIAVACALAVMGAACNAGPLGDSAPPSAPPPLRTAVGPVPGIGEDAPQPKNPFANDRGAMGEGHQLFNRFNCSGCHGDHGGGGMGPSLRDVDWIYGATDAQLFDSIAHGRGHGMPSWGTKLNEDQIWKLVAYIKSFRTPNEIAPPS